MAHLITPLGSYHRHSSGVCFHSCSSICHCNLTKGPLAWACMSSTLACPSQQWAARPTLLSGQNSSLPAFSCAAATVPRVHLAARYHCHQCWHVCDGARHRRSHWACAGGGRRVLRPRCAVSGLGAADSPVAASSAVPKQQHLPTVPAHLVCSRGQEGSTAQQGEVGGREAAAAAAAAAAAPVHTAHTTHTQHVQYRSAEAAHAVHPLPVSGVAGEQAAVVTWQRLEPPGHTAGCSPELPGDADGAAAAVSTGVRALHALLRDTGPAG
jgi:hypothetical protein